MLDEAIDNWPQLIFFQTKANCYFFALDFTSKNKVYLFEWIKISSIESIDNFNNLIRFSKDKSE